jgi:hypothetical protein
MSLSLRFPSIPSFLVSLSLSVSFLPLFPSSDDDSKILLPCSSRSRCTAVARLTRTFQKLICLEAALRLHRRMAYHLHSHRFWYWNMVSSLSAFSQRELNLQWEMMIWCRYKWRNAAESGISKTSQFLLWLLLFPTYCHHETAKSSLHGLWWNLVRLQLTHTWYHIGVLL